MKIDQIVGSLQSIVWQLDSSDVSGAKNDLNTVISEIENGEYDVDVDEDGPFIIGGDTGIDADFNIDEKSVNEFAKFVVPTVIGPNHRPIIESEDDWLDYMADTLAAEQYVELGYENGVEPEVYA